MMTLMTMTLMKVVVSLEWSSSDLISLIEVPHGLPMHLLLTMKVKSEIEKNKIISLHSRTSRVGSSWSTESSRATCTAPPQMGLGS